MRVLRLWLTRVLGICGLQNHTVMSGCATKNAGTIFHYAQAYAEEDLGVFYDRRWVG